MLPSLGRFTPGAVATGASIATGAAQNAAETFVDTEGQDMADRYKGAGISGAASLVLGKLLGGGAEGVNGVGRSARAVSEVAMIEGVVVVAIRARGGAENDRAAGGARLWPLGRQG